MGAEPGKMLRELEGLRDRRSARARRMQLLGSLRRRRLGSAREVLRFHEVLCFLRAYPEDSTLLCLVEAILEEFDRRGDLRAHREELADTGIAGTPIHYPFYAPMARRLAARWGDHLHLDWESFESAPRLRRMLYLMAPAAETPPPDELSLTTREWIDRLRGPDETDAAFLVRWFEGLETAEEVKDWMYEDFEVPLRLEPGQGTPSRTRARLPVRRVVWQRGALDRSRPDLATASRRRPEGVEELSPARARRYIDAAREAMVTRSRDLDVFATANPKDVRLVDWGDGHQFAVMGSKPKGRYLLEAVYGFLTLKNGVPIGYVLASALFGSSEIAYNVFETYRGAEAGLIFGRAMATVRHLFGSDAFVIDPYQLGHGNTEAQESGAWWFYRKFGFRPLDPSTRRLMRREEQRMKRKPSHRSSLETLRKLARHHVYYQLGPFRRDVLTLLPLSNVGMAVTRYQAERFGSARARRTFSDEAAALLGIRSPRSLDSWTGEERHAWERWAPLVLLLPGVRRWSAANRRALVRVIRAKGGEREADFARLFDRHLPLRRSLLRLAGGGTNRAR